MTGEIRKCFPDDCDAQAKFMEKYFPMRINGIIKRSRTASYYNWKYGMNPFGESITYAYWEGSELLGTFGAIAEPLAIRKEKVLAYQVVDAFVAPQRRGKGIFGRLADLVFDEIDKLSEISFGMDPSEYSLPIFINKFNMYVGPTYRQVFSPIRFDDILRAKQLNFVSPIGNLMNIIRNHILSAPSIEVEEINEIDPSCYPTLTDETDFCIIRDQQYVKYRYILCPEPYRFFKVQDHSNAVVMIIKFIKWRDMNIAYLVDIMGNLKRENSLLFLCEALYAIGLRTSSALVSVELHNPRNELSKLRYKGFLCHNREEVLFMRQSSWPFLRPPSDDYNSKRWIIFSGDGDNY